MYNGIASKTSVWPPAAQQSTFLSFATNLPAACLPPACRQRQGKGRAKAEAQSFDFNMTFLSGLGLFWLFFNF
jgi:hypothetical protein